MNVAISTALSGISAANERLRASASNIANMAASSQSRESVEPTNVDKVPAREINPANEIVEQQSAVGSLALGAKAQIAVKGNQHAIGAVGACLVD